jgi:ubiquinone/menaquinone biosynthesis C-methylase UbiE
LDTLGVDVAQTAIEQARAKAANRCIAATFVVADGLQLGRLGRTFRSALDCGLFHTFDDQERLAYVASLATALEPGGLLHLLCFSDMVPGDGGPRHVSQAELRSCFSNGWQVVSIDADRYETKFNADGSPAWLARIERT